MSSPISLLRFGNFSLDLRQRALLYNEDHVSLTPKAFEILLFLVENRGSVVSKDDLMKHVWGEITVEESNLSKNISFLRKTLANTTRGNGQDKSAGENDKLRWSRFDGHEILLAESSNLYEKNISKIYRQQDLQNPSQV